jgi:hypothetical protein
MKMPIEKFAHTLKIEFSLWPRPHPAIVALRVRAKHGNPLRPLMGGATLRHVSGSEVTVNISIDYLAGRHDGH